MTALFSPPNFAAAPTAAASILECGAQPSDAAQGARLEALGMLAAGMAHDCNTLLGSILCYTDMADDLMPPAGHAYLQQVRLACRQASQLLGRVLDFAAQHDGAMQVLPVAAAVQQALQLVRPMLGPRISLSFDNRLPQAGVLAQDGMLQQIVLNLSINAAQAMAAGGQLQVTLQASAARAGQLELVVADNGCGMSPQVQARIFEAFFSTRGAQGSGLGLAVVHDLVQRLRGEIVVHSRSTGSDCGTRFCIYLPIAAEPLVEE
ncbi:ATP-binding protein [Duganella fentianensis]|uniref:sensor histidine kinase n=1 Tax=Duganella fentianensis TaxID=2692177 RepID=UPI0032B13CAD